jgi:hypothetical protein
LELSFLVFPLVLIVGQPKKSGNRRKFHASANQIPESDEIMIFSKKISALRARSPPETWLELSFQIFPLFLVVSQQKKSRNSKKEQTSVNSSGVNQSRQKELMRTLALRVQNLWRTNLHAPKSCIPGRPTIYVLNNCQKPIPHAF